MAAWWKPLLEPAGLLGLGLAALAGLVLLSRRQPGSSSDGWLPWAPPGIPPVDPYADKEIADSCDPTAKPGVLAFREWAITRFGERPGSPQNIVRGCDDKADEHQEGRAWDLMVNDLAHGQAIVDALLAPDPETGEPHALARRAGVMYMIFDRQMWRAYPQGSLEAGAWSPYSGASPHTDHVHFSFGWPGARGETSFYQLLAAGQNVA